MIPFPCHHFIDIVVKLLEFIPKKILLDAMAERNRQTNLLSWFGG
jgi:hypothetical protein